MIYLPRRRWAINLGLADLASALAISAFIAAILYVAAGVAS